jgi:GNAT superfamily N-acetyltransferase
MTLDRAHPDVAVRLATAADVPVLRSIAAAAYLPYVPRIGRAPAPVDADYAGAAARGEAWLAVCAAAVGADAVGADAAVGLIVLVPEAGYLLLENVAVLPSCQGRGVGSLLLRFAEAKAVELGLVEIRLYTNEAMTENLAYYPRHGYRETHRGEQDGFRRVYFSKQLARTSARSRP